MSIALGRENIENQIKLAQTEAFNQLVRLLRTHKDSPQVILMVIQVLGILCVGQWLGIKFSLEKLSLLNYTYGIVTTIWKEREQRQESQQNMQGGGGGPPTKKN